MVNKGFLGKEFNLPFVRHRTNRFVFFRVLGAESGGKYGKYKEYHTSLDNKNLISFHAMKESMDMYYDVIKTIDENKCYKASVQFGTPQFSKSKLPIYPSTMNSNKYKPHSDQLTTLLELINLSDGNHDLLTIAEKRNFKMIDLLDIKDKLIKTGYLMKNNN